MISRYLGDTLSPDTVALITILSRLARLDTLSEKSSKFSSDLMECVVILVLHCHHGDKESVWQVLIELSQVSYEVVRGYG